MTAPPGGRRGLFDGFFDDAALFPPGDAPMAHAVPAHRELRARLGALVGPFVVPAARLDELSEHVSGDAPFAVSLIAAPGDLPSAVGRVLAHPDLTLAAVEVPSAADVRHAVTALDDLLPDAVPAAVEIPRDAERDAVLDVLAASRYRAKLRTGGLRADAFPSAAELAVALRACVTRGVAVKCTAGLHHAVRHTDPVTGFRHHGFLNVLLAVSALADGASADDAAAALGESDGPGLVAAVRAWAPERAARARGVFTSFGTCSVQEPVDDLVALGLLSLSDRIPS